MAVCTLTAAIPPAALPPARETENDANQVPAPNLLKLPSYKEAMKMKLKSSQNILEGIALNDFDKIQIAAEEIVIELFL